jgi:hypothetical protein
MSVSCSWENDPKLGKVPCKTDRESWQCPNMQGVKGDLSMTHEHYECKKCGRRVSIDYDEIR